MKRPFLGVALFTIVVLLLFVYIGEVLTRISGEGGRLQRTVGKEASPEAGEAIFWGKGTCYTCHSIGGRGSAIRGPNLGETGPLNMPIGARAAKRAEARAKQTGKPFTAVDYLVESLAEPAAYLVQGYQNIMPVIWKPPIALKPEQIKAVIMYLQSQGGTGDVAAVEKSPFFKKLEAAAAAAGAHEVTEAWKPYLPGDAEAGKELFFDPESPVGCAKCHTIGDRGGKVGPELTKVAAVQTPQYILESVLEPSKVVPKEFKPILIITKKGQYLGGIVKSEDEKIIRLADSQGKLQEVAKAEIAERVPQDTSLMPGNFAEILTVQDLHNLLAYLTTLK
ncbi:MAG: c-type cytochrome [Candidatus Tectimicrobiota bacterium]